jgi:predicted RNase H-like nuclease (RuvC/YqgF family)
MLERTKRLEIRLTPKEMEQIESRMKEIGIRNRSAYLRKMALDGYMIQMDLSDVGEAVRLLRINSNNLNQYTKKANEIGSIYQDDIRELQEQQEKLWDIMKEILGRLSTI